MSSAAAYGAITAKSRAMYGKLLTDADFGRLTGMKNSAEIATFLGTHPGWYAVSELSPTSTGEKELERALRVQVSLQYEGLYKFASGADKKYLLFTVHRFLLDRILRSLRALTSGGGWYEPEPVPEFIKDKCRADIGAIDSCKSFAALADACGDTIYGETLAALPRERGESGLPEYAAAAVALESRYYTALFSFLKRGFAAGPGRDRLLRLAGLEADLLNITHLLRILRYFPRSLKGADALLIPVSHRLKRELVHDIIAAGTYDKALDVLRGSMWKDLAAAIDVSGPEREYERRLGGFCVRLMRSGEPSVCPAVAFLTLKELERKKLTRVIEAVRFGVPASDVI